MLKSLGDLDVLRGPRRKGVLARSSAHLLRCSACRPRAGSIDARANPPLRQPAVWQANRLPQCAPPVRPPHPSAHTPARWHRPCQTLCAHTLLLLRARPHVHGLRAPRSISARHALRLTLTSLLPALKGLCHAQTGASRFAQWWQSCAGAGRRGWGLFCSRSTAIR
jgi:hypothetical protein